MKQLSPEPAAGNLRVFVACLLSFTILITPFAAIAAPRGVIVPAVREGSLSSTNKEANTSRSSLAEPFVNPPAPVPQPLPPPPAAGLLTATMVASMAPVTGDVDGDGKADPGDTIKYTVTLDNTTGTLAGTGLIFTDTIDTHTTLSGTWNSTPVAFDQSVSTNEDTAVPITLTGEDPDGTPLSLFTIVTPPAHGTLTLPGGTSASRTYTPAADYNGSDFFTFKVNDGTADSNQVGTVNITVVGVNDAPCFAATASPCVPALPGAQTFNEDTPRVFNTAGSNRIRVSDVDSGASNVTFTASVLHGTINVSTAGVSVTGNNTANVSVVGTVANIDTAINGLTYTPTLNYNGSDTLSLGINDGGNTGLGGALSASASIAFTVNPVNDAPVVANKSFSAKANMKISYQINLAANGTGDVTDADNNDAGFTNTFTLTSVTGACTAVALPCTISNINPSTGTFDFDPPPGSTVSVILNYTVTDNGRPTPGQVSAPGTITIALSGPVIWFVDPTRTNDGNGTLSNTSIAAGGAGPFKLLSSATAKLATLAPNQRVFVYSGTTTAAIGANAGEVLTLKDNNWLIGQGTIGSDFDTLFGLLGGNAAPLGTIARPSINGTRPTLQGAVTMANNTIVSGLNIDVSPAAAGSKGLKSSGFTAGTSAISDVNVKSAAGTAVDLTGAQTVTYTTSNSSTSPNILNSTAGGALSVVSTTIGSSGFNFQSISANGGANGIILTTIGSGPFSVTGIGTTAGSGGTIQNCTQHGAAITGTAASVVTMKNMNFTANGTNLSDPTTPSHCGDIFGTAFNTEAMCGAGISLTNIGSTGSAGSGTTLDRISVTNGQQVGINIQGGANVTLTNSTVSGNGNQVSENGLQALNLQGTMTITDSNFTNNAANQIDATLNSTATANLIFDIKGTAPGNSLIRGFTAWPTNGTSNAGIRLGSYASGRTLDFSATDVNLTNSFSAAFLVRTDTGGHMVFDVLRGVFSDNGMNIDIQGQGSGNMTYTVDDITTNVNPAHTSVGSFTFAKGATASGNWNGTIKNCDIGTAGVNKSGSPFTGLRVISGTSGQYTATITNNIINEVGQHGIDMSSGKNISNDSGSFNWVVTGNTINATATAPLASGQGIFATAGSASGDSSCVHATIGGAGALKNTIGGTWSGSVIRVRNRFTTTNFFVVGYGGATVGDNSAAIAAFVSGQNGGVSTTATATDPSAVATPFNDLASCPLLLANGGVMAALNSPSLLSAIFAFPDRVTADILEGNGTASGPLDKSQLSQSITQDRLDSIVTAAIDRWSATGLTTQQIATLRAIKFDVANLGGSYLGEADGNLVLVDGDAQGKGWFVDATPQSDSEFGAATGTRRYTDPMSAPAGHVDLLTAIMHEMGHKLGLEDSYAAKDRDNLMYGYLTVGERRIPSSGQATTAIPNQYASAHFLSLITSDETTVSAARADVTAALVGETLKARMVAAPLSSAVAAIDAHRKTTPMFASASASVSGERTIASASQNQVTSQQPVVSPRAGIRLNHANIWPGITTKSSAVIRSMFVAPLPAGETVTVNGTGAGFSLPIGKSTTITFNVTMNNPPNLSGVPPATPKISNQGTLSGGFDGNPLNTDDPSTLPAPPPASNADATTTPVDLFNSTTTVTSPGATNVNKPVTYTATVAATGSPAPAVGTTASGKMIFKDGGVIISGCGNVDVVSSVATCTTSPSSGGTHNITAFYSGDGSFDPSDNSGTPFGQSVLLSDTATAVTSSSPSNTSLVGQNVTFTATVTSQTTVTGPPTGTATFKADGVAITCSNGATSVQPLSGGVATCQTTALTATAVGVPHVITADYAGDGGVNGSSTFNNSTGTLSGGQTVNKSGTTTALASSANPSNVGQNVTFTATVSSATVIPGPPAGTVTFKSDGVAITCSNGATSVQPLSGGVATCQTTALTALGSPHDITGDYAGDGTANGSAKFTNSSGALAPKQAVNTSNTTTTLSSSSPANTSLVSQNVTFTATVGSATPGTPEGTVEFKDNGTAITCTNGGTSVQTMSGGVATCQTASLTAAGSPHDITGDYTADPISANGSAKFNNSNGALSPKQTVNKSGTTTTLSPSGLTPNVGDSVTFTATVTSQTAVTGPPAGTAQFLDGATPITCTENGNSVQTLNGGGVATCTTTTLSPGLRSITAVYTGDGSANGSSTFNGSTSNVVSQQVGAVCSNAVVVTSNADSGSNTLREAIDLTACDGGTITFSGVSSILLLTELTVNKNLTITGPGAASLTVSGNNVTRVFTINALKTATISGMTISGGKVVGAAGAPNGSPAFGGGISNAGTLTLQNAIVSDNHATGGAGAAGVGVAGGAGGDAYGGAIFNSGTLTLTGTTVNGGNSATGGKGGNSDIAAGGNGGSGFGGGIYNSGTLTLTTATVNGNSATGGAIGTGAPAGTAGFGSGAGVYNDASASAASTTVTNSTISGNTAGQNGAGIYSVGNSGVATLSITGSTINGNTAGLNGGGIYNAGTVTSAPLSLTNSTISGNLANNNGGGIFNDSGTSTVTLTSVTITGNQADSDGDSNGTGGGISQNGTNNLLLKNTIVAGNMATSLQVETATVTGGPITSGVKQKETITVSGGPVVQNGDILVRVTAAGVNLGATQTLNVTLASLDTDAGVATKIQTALQGNVSINNFFNISTSGADVILEAKTEAANDGTMHVSIVGSVTGINSAESSPVPPAGQAPVTGIQQAETITLLSGPSACTAPEKVQVDVTAGNMVPTTVTLHVPVTAGGESADALADDILTYINTSADADAVTVRGFFTVTKDGTAVLRFTAQTATTNDPSMKVIVSTGTETCTVTTSTSTVFAGGVAPVTGVQQVEKVTVSGAPVIQNGDIRVIVTAANMVPSTKTVLVSLTTAATTNDSVADAIEAALTADLVVGGFFNITSPGADVTLQAQTAAANDGSMHVSIRSVTGINSAESSPTLPAGASPGNAKVTVTAAGMPNSGTPILVAVATGDSASDVAGKMRTALTLNGDVNGFFMVSGAGVQIVLTRRIVTTNDGTLNIATANDTSVGLGNELFSANTKEGGTATPDDISGTVDPASSYNLIGDAATSGGIVEPNANNNRVGNSGTGTIAIATVLNPLANNSGPTMTHSLPAGSTALENGNAFGLTTDQRGFLRPVNLADIGAFEKQAATGTPDTPVLTSTNTSGTTRDTTPDFSIGSVTTGATVELLRGGVSVASGTAAGSTIALTDNTLTTDGVYFYQARQTLGGDQSPPSTAPGLQVTVDTRPSAPDLIAADDTGSSAIDNRTKNTTLTFTGTSDPNVTVKLFAGPTQVGTGVASAGGVWSITTNIVLSEGSYSMTANESVGLFTGAAGAAMSPLLVIDTTLPTPAKPDLKTGSDSGTDGDEVTNAAAANSRVFDITPTETGSVVELYRGVNFVATAPGNGGLVTLTDPTAQLDGSYNYTTRETDVAGNVGTSAILAVTIDTLAPAQPSLPDLQTGSDTGDASHQTDNLTKAFTAGSRLFDLSFTAEANSTIELLRDTVPTSGPPVVIASGSGATSPLLGLPDPDALSDGVYAYTVRHKDLAGNISTSSTVLQVTIDKTAPTPAIPDLKATSDSGADQTDNVTNAAAINSRIFDITGTETGSLVELYRGIDFVASTTGNGGMVTLTDPTFQVDGLYDYTTKETDVAGNSGTSAILQVRIDTAAPAQPSLPDLQTGSDTGDATHHTDNITSAAAAGSRIFDLSFTAEANSTIELLRDTVPPSGTPVVVASGPFAISPATLADPNPLADGSYLYYTRHKDLAGNASALSTALQVTIDTTAPTVASITRLNPLATTTNAASVDFAVTFSEPVTGVDPTDFKVTTTGGIPPSGVGSASITSVTPNGDGIHYTVTVNTGSGNGNLRLDVVDDNSIRDVVDLALGGAAMGDGNFNTGQVYIVNKTNAFVNTINRAGTNPTNAANVDFTVTFSTPVTGVDASDFFVTAAGITGGPPAVNPVVSGSGTTYTVTVSTGTGTSLPDSDPHTIRLDLIDNDSIKDGANAPLGGVGVCCGGAGDASFTGGQSYDIDKTAPTVTASVPVGQANPAIGPSATTTINFTVVFSEAVTSFTSSAVQITGTATSGTTTASVSGSGTTYNVAVSGMTPPPSGTGTVTITVPAGAAPDPAGNANTVSNSATVTFTKDDFSTLEVNSLADPGDGPCTAVGTGDGCTLREAINAANFDFGADTITFAPALTSGGAATITLLTALPDITTDITIQGPGSGSAVNLLTVQRSNAAGRFRIFNTNSAAVTISRLIISSGLTADGANNVGGTGAVGVAGGGILNSGTLNLTNVTVSGNQTGAGGNGMFGGPGGPGGGISNTGTLTITGSTINNNQTGHGGDGNAPPPPNGAGGTGAGIFNTGTLRINNSTISGNQTGAGGSNGSSGNGGGIYTDIGTVTLINLTITLNSAGATGTGGGINVAGGTVTLRNTIVGGGNTASSGIDILGTVQSDGFNLIQSIADATINPNPGAGPNITGADPLLNALGANGGPTMTHSVQCTSPVIDKGTATLTTLAGAIDNVQTSINVTSASFIPAGVGFVIVIDSEQMVVTSKVGNTLTVTRAANGTTAAAHANLASVLPPNATDQRGGIRPFDLADSVYGNAVGGDGSEIGAYETQSGGGCLPEAIPPSPQPSTTEDTGVQVTLRGEYSQNTNLVFTVTPPAHGTLGAITNLDCQFGLKMVCTAKVIYTPAADFNGLDTFKFKAVTNPGGLESDEADVNITVTAVNDPPLANGDALTDVAEDSGVRTIPFADLLGNDSPGPANESGQILNIISVGSAVGGAVSIQGTDVLFTPAANFNGPASFKYTVRDNGTTNGAADPKDSVVQATVVFNVTPTPDTPSVTNSTTNEDTQTTSGLVVSRNAGDGAEVTNFKITGITNGTLFQTNGTTPINNGDFITIAQGAAGLKFTPAANLFSPTTTFSFQAQASLDNTDAGLGGGLATATITVNAIADTPSVTNASTSVNTQTTSGLVISRNAADSTEVTNVKITNIQNGTLFKNNGTTQINNNDFITAAEGNAGLKFTPATNLLSPGTTFSFDVQASTSNANAGLGGSVVTATITVTCGGSLVVNSNDSGAGSLRAILLTACPGTTITFDMTPGHVTSPITLASELVINKSLTIQGPGANLLTIAGNNTSRLINVNSAGVNLSIDGLSITGGGTQAGASGSAIEFSNAGTLTLANSEFFANSGTGIGVVSANLSTGITINGSTFRGNTATVVVKSDRTPMTVVNSTFSGNTGTAIYSSALGSTVTNSTVADNSTGIQSDSAVCGGCAANVTVTNTLLSNNGNFNLRRTGTATLTSGGRNLIDDGTAAAFSAADPTNIIVAAGGALIGPLANNGGPTQTRALLAGSPALDAGDNAAVVNPPFSGAAPFNDQRGPGFLRIRDAADVNTAQTVDIGAYEADPSIEDISNKATTENTPVSFVFNLGDAATAFDSITTNSSNTTLLPNANIQISGSGSSRTMTLTPAANTSGTSTVTVTVTKTLGGAPRSMSDTFLLGVNDGGTLQFSSGTYSVVENAGPGAVTITRTGGTAGTATVQVATSNGTAVAGTDYTAVSQTVTFNDGETSKVVTVPIIDNLNNQPNRTINLTLSNVGGSGQLGAPITAVLTILDDDPTGGYIRFSAPSYTVGEGAGAATITVERLGTLTQPVTVDYDTSDDSNPPSQIPCAPTPGNTTATSRCDFNTAIGRITFGAGDGAPKTFTVLINQDTYLEGPENLPLTLSNLTGGATFASPSTATLNITDDDLVAPTGNTIDDPASFVKQHYRDFLNREADAAGLAFWTNQITSCGADPQCIELKRVNVSAAFFLSIEFQVTGGTAYLTNRAAYGGLPSYVRFETDAQALGRNYVFGAPGAEAVLEANKVAYFNEYVTRTEFTDTYNGESDQSYVNTLISNTGVAFTQLERDALINGLANHTETRATVLRKISEKPSFRQAEFNSMFVLMEYFGYLHRNPDNAGFNFWLNKLNQFNGNFIQADMVKAFINSAEYRQRFGP